MTYTPDEVWPIPGGFCGRWYCEMEGVGRLRGFDLVLLDLGLPERDGLEVLRELRSRGDATPVIIVTARDDVQNRIQGLDAGADDYIVKPFDLDEGEVFISASVGIALSASGHDASAMLLRNAVRAAERAALGERGHRVAPLRPG